MNFFLILLVTSLQVIGQEVNFQFNNLDENGLIISGYDPVAFFKDSKPVEGDENYTYEYKGAKYQFSSIENLNSFKSEPEKYKPQFGGWCAYAVSLGRIAPIDVAFWSIQDGRLIMQHNKRADAGWKKDPSGNMVLADKYWPEVAAKNGEQILTDAEKEFYNNTDKKGVSLDGYDPVAYFTLGKPSKGKAEYTARYQGATYWFMSQSHADMFKNNPEKFSPLYGGFCGYAMSLSGKRKPIDPKLFTIVDEHLIVQHSKAAVRLWEEDINGNKGKADGYWPGVVEKYHGEKTAYD